MKKTDEKSIFILSEKNLRIHYIIKFKSKLFYYEEKIMKTFILLAMLALHVKDDYTQGIIADFKQKKWWEKNYPDKMYKNDYIIALLMHCIKWSFMIMLPINIYCLIFDYPILIGVYIMNVLIHAIIDDYKANKLKINLITDQLWHVVQIIATWITWLIVC